MGTFNADLQAAVDSTSVAKDAGVTTEDGLLDYLREQLAERDVQTSDEAWLQRCVEGIKADRNYMVEGEPEDFDPGHTRS